MKSNIFTIPFILLSLSFCNNVPQVEELQEIPQLLESDQSRLTAYSSSRYSIFENLYQFELDQNGELKELQSKIDNYQSLKLEKQELINEFLQVNQLYYEEASLINERIHNEELKSLIENMITGSEADFNRQLMQPIEEKKSNIDSLGLLLEDYQSVLKIAVTLPLIEQFQLQDNPGLTSFDQIIKLQEEIIDQQKIIIDSNN